MVAPNNLLARRQGTSSGGGFRALARDFRRWFMPSRPDWNRMGERLPLWFRARLKQIDPKLVLQFVPPTTIDPAGVPAAEFPKGCWYICGRLRRTRYLTKRAVFILIDKQGRPARPTMTLIRMLREARNLRRRDDIDALERMFEEGVERLKRETDEKTRDDLRERIVGTMCRMNLRSQPGRVFVTTGA